MSSRHYPVPTGCHALVHPYKVAMHVVLVWQGLFATLGGAFISTLIGVWFGTVLLTLKTHRWEGKLATQ